MNLSAYAKIGKGPMIKAIGLQDNHKIVDYIENKQLDRAESGCFCCPNYQLIDFAEYLPEKARIQAMECCERCPHKAYKSTFTPVVKYINERNKYGYQERLSLNAIKILLMYHFYNPNSMGLIKDIRPKDVAQFTGCTVKTVYNVNSMLSDYGYIHYCHGSSMHSYHIILSEYPNYFKSASEGGRGYTIFTRELLTEFMKIKDVNQLRILLRSALEYDSRKKVETPVEVSYQDARRYLPHYCKPNIIVSALSKITKFFKVTFAQGKAILQLGKSYCGTDLYDQDVKDNEEKIKDFFSSLDMRFDTVNKAIENNIDVSDLIQQIHDEGYHTTIKLKDNKHYFINFMLQDQDAKDLAILATTYSLERVIKWVPYVYENYRSHFDCYHIGALIRTFLKKEDTENTLAFA